MKKSCIVLSALLLFTLSGPSARASIMTIGFDSFSDHQNIAGIDLGGVTISSPDHVSVTNPHGVVRIYGNGGLDTGYVSPLNSIGPSTWETGKQLLLTFDQPVEDVSITGGDMGGDTDDWSIEAFDEHGTSLGLLDTGAFDNPDPVFPLVTTMEDYRTLTLQAQGIHSVVLTQVNWGVVWDNLTFQTEAVPEPASLLLLGSGITGLWVLHRRNRHAA